MLHQRRNFGFGLKEEHLRVRKQRSKVDHSSDTDKEQQRESLRCLNAGFKEPLDDSMSLTGALHKLV